MPTISERIKGFLSEREEAEKKSIEIAWQARKEEEEELEHSLELNKKAIKLIQPEQILNELNIHLLRKKGKIVKNEGLFTHSHYRSEGGGYDGSYLVDFPYTHAISSVSLLWRVGKRGWEESHRLMVAVWGEKVQYRAGRVFWNSESRGDGYPSVLRLFCHTRFTDRPTKSVPFEIQNLEDREKLGIIRKQIQDGIVSIFSELLEKGSPRHQHIGVSNMLPQKGLLDKLYRKQ